MTRAIILEPDEWQDFKKEMIAALCDEAKKAVKEVHESPMNRKETAMYLKCSVKTVDKNWMHLRHVVNGTPMWYRDEIEKYIKEQ
jgi:hypothetical protein